MTAYHIPVLLNESIEALAVKPDGVYVDATFGGGGHSRALLGKLGPTGRLIAFDKDADALANAPRDKRLILVHNNFRWISRIIVELTARPEAEMLSETGTGTMPHMRTMRSRWSTSRTSSLPR